jgi:glycosyltransferase involved in cell wall biosynthesis
MPGIRLKLAYLVNTYPRASHTFIRREVQALERAGHSVHRFAMRSDRAALVDTADLAEDGRTEHVLAQGMRRLLPKALGWMVRNPRHTLTALRLAVACGAQGTRDTPGTGGRLRHMIYLIEAAYIARRCAELRIAHLHAHFGTNSTTVAMLSQALGGPRYSFTVHGPEEFDAPAALSLGTKIERAAFTVAISSFGRSQLCRWVDPSLWHRLHVVPCGIEPWRFPATRAMPPGGPHLVAIGRLSPQKGFDVAIEAVAMARAALPDLHLTLVGDGPLRAALTAAIAAQDLGGAITLTGWQDEEGVRTALSAAQALIVPSFAEGLPMVVIEAMAAGRPVIATAIAGIPELVTPDTGWLVPAGDAGALTMAIAGMASLGQDRLVEMGNAARTRVMARHDIDQSATLLVALFADAGVP